jgi:hypothetical protein
MVSDQPQVCSVRGCNIGPGAEHWRKTWNTSDSPQTIESVYCRCCGDASRCTTGIVLLGPVVLVLILVGSFVILPILWPGHMLGYFTVFMTVFWLTVWVSSRWFYQMFGGCQQLKYHAPLPPDERRQLRKQRPAAA